MPAYFTLSKTKIQYINGIIVHICKTKRRKLASEAREMAGGIQLKGPSKEYSRRFDCKYASKDTG